MSQDQSKDEPVRSADGGQTFKKPGDLIARQYEVVEVLGEGGASVVYRAKHAVLETECAIKVLLPDRLPDSRAVQRFQLEAKSISRLEHPNIVAVHEFGIDDDNQPYLVMEVVDGKSLAQLVEENSFLRPKRALALFTQIAEALMHAHSRSVLHRDLKPKNVIVGQASKGSESARLVDFGIAKITEIENENKSLTKTGEVFGSPLYMSPEQCKGQPLDQRSDIYSFGCLMYEVITGKAAARADSVLETLMLHVNGLNLDFDNAPPAVILKESAQKKSSEAVGEYKCFNGLRRVIETCTHTDPEKRYQNSRALLHDFQLIARGQMPTGAKSSPIDINFKRIGCWQWRPTKASIGLAISFCVLVFSGIVIPLSGIVIPLNEGERKPLKTEKERSTDQKFAGVLNDLDSSKAHERARQRLPIVRKSSLLKRTLLEGRPIVEVAPKGLLYAGPHGAFNSYSNDNMIVVATSYDRAPLAKMQRLGCADYLASSQVITDGQLSNLARLKNIDWLALSFSTGFSKNGLAAFRGTALKKLYLGNTKMDDQWTPVLSSLPLTTLGLRQNKITDKGVEHLAKSKTLKFILLEENPISEIPPAFKHGGWRLLPDEDRQYKWFTRK